VSELTVFACGVKCDHQWDGPEIVLTEQEHGINGATLTCSKCGAWAINVSMLEAELGLANKWKAARDAAQTQVAALTEAVQPFAKAYTDWQQEAKSNPHYCAGPHNRPTYRDFEFANAALTAPVTALVEQHRKGQAALGKVEELTALAGKLAEMLIDLRDAAQDARCADLRVVLLRAETALSSTAAQDALAERNRRGEDSERINTLEHEGVHHIVFNDESFVETERRPLREVIDALRAAMAASPATGGKGQG